MHVFYSHTLKTRYLKASCDVKGVKTKGEQFSSLFILLYSFVEGITTEL